MLILIVFSLLMTFLIDDILFGNNEKKGDDEK